MNIFNNNHLLGHCCLGHLVDSQGSEKRLSLLHRRGLKLSAVSKVCDLFSPLLHTKDKEIDFHMPDW